MITRRERSMYDYTGNAATVGVLSVANLLTGVPLIDNLLIHDQFFVKSLHSFF